MANRNLSNTAAVASLETHRPSKAKGNPGFRRLVVLLPILVIVLTTYWVVIGRTRWRERQYARASLTALGNACAKQGDIQACTWLCNRSIAANHPEQSVAALKACWHNVQTGKLPVSTKDRALLEGDLALALMLSLKIDEAAPLFQDVFVLDYQCVPAHLALALWLQDKQRVNPALHELKVVTTLAPDNDLAWYLMAHLYVTNNKLDEGRAAAQNAIAINPKVAAYWQELGDSFGYASRHEESLKAYTEELKLDPTLPVAQADVARATALSAKTPAQYEDAVRKLQDAIKTNSVNTAPGYTLLGQLYLKFGHYREASEALKKSIQSDGTIPEVYYNLARALQFQGDSAGAARTMHQYEDMNTHFLQTQKLIKQVGEMPDNPDVHLALAHAWEYYKAWPQVWGEYQQVLHLRPKQAEALHGLQQITELAAQHKDRVPYNWVLQELLRSTHRQQIGDEAPAQSGPASFTSFGK